MLPLGELNMQSAGAYKRPPKTASPHQIVVMSSDNVLGEAPRKKKSNYPSFFKNVTLYGSEFTENTSLHGVRYLGESKRNIFEKIWWMLVIAGSLFICIALIYNTYQKWDNSPVIVSFAQSPTPVWQIPFPAVTICPETKSRQTLFNFTKYYHQILEDPGNMTDEEIDLFGQVALACDTHLYHDGNNTVGIEAIHFLSKVAPQFDEVFWQCRWTNKNETCDQLYTPILTEEGVCYTFNMLDRDDIFRNEVFHNMDYMKHNRNRSGWTLETGYLPSEGKDTFPRRALSAGASAGLTMLMRGFEYDLDYICKGPVQGFKILLHHPFEIPRVSSQYFRLPINQEVVVAVKPDMMTTSERLLSYDPKRRHCYFSSERYLRFYKNYTQQNCDVECLANYTLQLCECVAYHMPHEESTSICGPGRIVCMTEAKDALLANQVSSALSEELSANLTSTDFNLNCDCLPACTSLSYEAETSQADFDWRSLILAFKGNVTEFPGIWMARMTMFFKEQQFITSERNELYGLTDFLANCGGLLGLFIGFSFLSAVETFYFLTLRLFCNIRRHGVHYWSGNNDLLQDDAYLHNNK